MSGGVPKWISGMMAMFSGAVGHPAIDTGPIGTPLSAFQKTSDFFGFFNFVETGRSDRSDRRKIISFKPSGDALHALVTLEITTEDQDRIQILHLIVARSFIDDPKKTIFAADLVKTYLGYAAGKSEKDPISELAQEISARALLKSNMPILTAQPLPMVRGPRSAAYDIYAGQTGEVTMPNSAATLYMTLRNPSQSPADAPALELVMSARSL
jgi:hypothetical protein